MTIGLVNLRLPGCHRKHQPSELCGARGHSKMVGVRKSWFSKATFEIICHMLSKLYLNASKNGDTSKSAEAVY